LKIVLRVLRIFVVVLVLAAPLGGAKFTGVVSDGMCPKGDHSQMRMGSNDAECAVACVNAHGAEYVLHDGKKTYKLTTTRTLEPFAGRKVEVVGELDAAALSIKVESISLAK
jgi:hypothetical protein